MRMSGSSTYMPYGRGSTCTAARRRWSKNATRGCRCSSNKHAGTGAAFLAAGVAGAARTSTLAMCGGISDGDLRRVLVAMTATSNVETVIKIDKGSQLPNVGKEWPSDDVLKMLFLMGLFDVFVVN